jgi:ABC-type phosphate transport system substrate-binding protein
MTFQRHLLVLLVLVMGTVVLEPARLHSALAAEGGLVLVVGKDSPIGNISRAELNRLFSGDAIKIDGQPAVPFALAPNRPERHAFDQIVLGMSPDEANKYWIDRRIRGQGNPPKSAPSPDVMARAVASFPAAIGYLPPSALTPALKPVAIDGKSYTDRGYLLGQAR